MDHGSGGGRKGRTVGVSLRSVGPISRSFALSRTAVCRISFCLVIVGPFGAASAQDLTPLVTQCASGGSPALLTSCQSAVLAAQAIRGGIAITDATGASLSGSWSTIGRRLGSTPRVSVDLRGRVARFSMPDLVGGGPGIAADNDVYVYGIKGSVAVGVLDGFSLMPTVGGILSLDLLASASLLFLGESDGFLGNEGLASVGGRIGIFRESFSLPGLTVSAMRSFGQQVNWADDMNGTQIDTDISTTSVRAVIGKDFFTLAVLAGFGWNWDHGEMRVQVPDPTIPGGQGVGLMEDLTTRRAVYFAGVSITRLVWTFSIEGGWIGGYDGLTGYPGVYDPGAITPFISVAARLTI